MIRAFVFTEPYGPLDVTICKTFGDAVKVVSDLTAKGKRSRVVETTGTANDLKPLQRQLRADYVTSLAQRVQS